MLGALSVAAGTSVAYSLDLQLEGQAKEVVQYKVVQELTRKLSTVIICLEGYLDSSAGLMAQKDLHKPWKVTKKNQVSSFFFFFFTFPLNSNNPPLIMGCVDHTSLVIT